MKNYIKIVPKHVEQNGFMQKLAEYVKLVSFDNYNFDDSSGTVKYEVYAVNRPTTDQGLILEYYELLSGGELPIPTDLVKEWGTDDTPIIEFVIQTLGFEQYIS